MHALPEVRERCRQGALRGYVALSRPQRLDVARVHVVVVVRLALPQPDPRVLERPDVSVPGDVSRRRRSETSPDGPVLRVFDFQGDYQYLCFHAHLLEP